ncbi:hypothetical protein DFH06DRAFT_1139911 [Mycena polygramma]|nr:hypothetical protein DFH06DRAFT_1139911 [Mycena polygramma]
MPQPQVPDARPEFICELRGEDDSGPKERAMKDWEEELTIFAQSIEFKPQLHKFLPQQYLQIRTSTESVFGAQKEVVWMLMEAKTLCAEMPGPGLSVIVSGQADGTFG